MHHKYWVVKNNKNKRKSKGAKMPDAYELIVKH